MPSDAVLIEIVRDSGIFLTAVMSALAAWFARRAVVVSKQTEQNTNHMKDELVSLTAKAAYAEGIKDEKERKK